MINWAEVLEKGKAYTQVSLRSGDARFNTEIYYVGEQAPGILKFLYGTQEGYHDRTHWMRWLVANDAIAAVDGEIPSGEWLGLRDAARGYDYRGEKVGEDT